MLFSVLLSKKISQKKRKKYNTQWLIDGYFKVSKAWTQLLVISVLLTDEHLLMPICFILCDSKNEKCYSDILEHFIKCYYEIDISWIDSVVVDFETTLINSIKKILKPKKIIGCFFHLSQALWKKALSLGLKSNYVKLVTIIMITSLQCLCFMNKSELFQNFNMIKERFIGISSDYEEFLKYFENFWLNEEKISLWNYTDLTNVKDFTNNKQFFRIFSSKCQMEEWKRNSQNISFL